MVLRALLKERCTTTLEECQRVVHTIVTASLNQVGDYLSTMSDSSSLLVAVSSGTQLLKTTSYPTWYKHPYGRIVDTRTAAVVPIAPAPAAQLPITLRASQEANKSINLGTLF